MRKLTVGVFLVAYLGTLFFLAPASVLDALLSGLSHGRFGLANSQGTFWNGSARPVIRSQQGGLIVLENVHWHFNYAPLLEGKLSLQLNWDDALQTEPSEILASFREIELRRLYVPLPGSLLGEVSDFLKPAQLQGKIVLMGEFVRITPNGIQGIARADWLNASSMLSNIKPLGNYRFTFGCIPGQIEMTLSTISGTLLLNGAGKMTGAADMSFDATAQAAQGKEAELQELLGHLGPETRPGIRTFSLTVNR